jgi:hypothetical protein
LRISRWFDRFGTNDSGFYVEMHGRGTNEQPKRVVFDIIAKAADGLMIPCTPAILLTLGLVRGSMTRRGAMPCVGLVDLDDLLHELSGLRITWDVVRAG